MVDAGWEVLHMRCTISCKHPWEVMPNLNFYIEPEKTEKEEQFATERLWPRRNFRVNVLLQFPSSLLFNLKPQAGLKVCLCAIQQFPTEDWNAHPATKDWFAVPTIQATEWVAADTERSLKLLLHKLKQNGNKVAGI